MIKRILRAGLGVIFFFVFFCFLLVGALKFRALSPKFWKTALDKGGVYQQLQDQVTKMRTEMEESIKKENGGRPLPPQAAKQLAPLLNIDKVLTAARFKELVETNIDRLFDYLNGKDKDLILYLPLAEWKLPVEALGQPGLLKLTTQTPLKDALPLLGVKPEQVKPITDGLGQAKISLGYLKITWIILLLLALGLGAAHFFLGVGIANRIKGTAWLVMVSGFIATTIGLSAGRVFELVAANSNPPIPTWGLELGKSLVNQFFSFGAMVGLGAGIAGLVTIVAVIILTKSGRINDGKETISGFKKVLSFVIGIILGFVILGAVLVVTSVVLGGKANLKVSERSPNLNPPPVEKDTTP